jgi:hypothetical protein
VLFVRHQLVDVILQLDYLLQLLGLLALHRLGVAVQLPVFSLLQLVLNHLLPPAQYLRHLQQLQLSLLSAESIRGQSAQNIHQFLNGFFG